MILPVLSPEAAATLRSLAIGERDIFSAEASPAEYAMSLRHAKAYEYAAQFAHGNRILDVGCGAGAGAVYLSTLADVSAIDVDERLVSILPSLWPGKAVRWQTYNGSRLPFADASFDQVTSFQVIEHVDNQARFCAEIRRVLRSPGIALITTPNRLMRVLPGCKPWNPYHIHELTSWGMRGLLNAAGFESVELLGLDGIPALSRPERIRCIRSMIAPVVGAIPAPVRRLLKRHKTSSAHVAEEESARCSDIKYALASYWWKKRRLYDSLDLLGVAVC